MSFNNSLGNKEIMARNIQRLMSKNNIDRIKMSKDLNVKYSTLSDWINGNTYPRIDKIELMANYFKVTKADLVEPYEEMDDPDLDTILHDLELQLDAVSYHGRPLNDDSKQKVIGAIQYAIELAKKDMDEN